MRWDRFGFVRRSSTPTASCCCWPARMAGYVCGTPRPMSRAADQPMVQAEAVTACAFGPEGRSILSGCRDGTAQLWEVATGRPLIGPLRHEAEVSSVAFSPDGRILLTGSLDGAAHFWDAHSGFPLGP